MKDKARNYAKLFSKVMKKLGRSDYKRLENSFYQRYTAHLNSEMYNKYRKTYPSIGTDKVYIGITFAQIMLELGYSLDEAIEAWETYMMADKLRMIESIIRLADFFGKGYSLCGNWLDKDKKHAIRTALFSMNFIIITIVSWNTKFTPAPMSRCLSIIISENSARHSAITIFVCVCCTGVQNSFVIPTGLTAIAATTN